MFIQPSLTLTIKVAVIASLGEAIGLCLGTVFEKYLDRKVQCDEMLRQGGCCKLRGVLSPISDSRLGISSLSFFFALSASS